MTTRREFLKRSALVGGALLGGSAGSWLTRSEALAAERGRAIELDLLVLGGTGFIGPHLVRLAIARGHRVTIFTRGKHTADLPGSVIRLIGDRNGKLEALEGKRWDAVIDDSATNPDWVRQSATLLQNAVGHYLFTSSTGVFYPYLARGLDESTAPLYEAADPKDPSAAFGVAKAQCERELGRAFGARAIVVRPTYIVGPGDTTDRFPYWPVRLAQGGEVLAPGKPDDPVQFIDVRDLAAFMLHLVETRQGGVFDAAGPARPMTAPEFYRAAVEALDARVTLTAVDDYAFLRAHGIEDAIPWAMLAGNDYGMMSIRNDRAVAAGLTFRPLADTVRDTLAWWPSVPAARRANPHFTITPEKEAAALKAWHAHSG